MYEFILIVEFENKVEGKIPHGKFCRECRSPIGRQGRGHHCQLPGEEVPKPRRTTYVRFSFPTQRCSVFLVIVCLLPEFHFFYININVIY